MKYCISILFFLIISLPTRSQTVEIAAELRLVNEKSCSGYVSKLSLPASKVANYLKKWLSDYGKNEGKKKTYAYYEAKVIGMTELVSIYAQIDKNGKESSEVWLGILNGKGESHNEARKMLYDLVLHIYLTEADKAIADAQRDYDKAMNEGIALTDKLQANGTNKIKFQSDLEKAKHEEEKLERHLEHAKKKTERLKEALNNVLTSNNNPSAIEKAQDHYDKAINAQSKLEKQYTNIISDKQKLQLKLVENQSDKTQLEAAIAQNAQAQIQLKQALENAKQARTQIR